MVINVAACQVVTCALSGMRNNELLALRVGCRRRTQTPNARNAPAFAARMASAGADALSKLQPEQPGEPMQSQHYPACLEQVWSLAGSLPVARYLLTLLSTQSFS